MLKVIYKYKNSIFGIIVVFFISLAMLGFGVNFWGESSGNEDFAIKVNDHVISDYEYNSTKENYVNSLRERFGDMYAQISSLINIDKQVRDTLVDRALNVQFAKELGLAGGDKGVALRIMELFPEDTSVNYSNFLRRTGRTPKDFEGLLRDILINEDYQNILSDLIQVTKTEVEAKVRKDRETFNVDYIEVNPENYKNTKEPSEEELLEYYNQAATDFEEKEKVSYKYVVFSPSDFESVIEPDENEVQLYYSENLPEFTEPEKILALTINIKKSDGEKKAKDVLDRLNKGEDFKKLIKEVSEDKNDTEKWYKRGDLDVDVEGVVFDKKQAGLSDVIEGKDFYTIVNVMDYQPETVKDLNSVKDQIKKEIIKSLAPAFAKDKADNLKILIDEGKEIKENLAWQEVPLSEAGSSPIEFVGLTDKILESPAEKAIITEFGDKVVLSQITEYKESSIVPFSDLGEKKAKLIEAFKASKLNDEVQKVLNKVIFDLKEKQLSEIAQKDNFKLEKFSGFSKVNTGEGFFAKPEIREAILTLNRKGDYSQSGVKYDNKYYIFQVTDVIADTKPVTEDEVLARVDKAKEEQRELSIKNILNVLQSTADIKFGRYINLN